MLAITMTSNRRAALALCAVLALACSACLPAVAGAELSAAGGIQEYVNKAQQQQETSATTTAVTSATETAKSSSISSSLVILAVVVGGLLLGGIAFVIVRDARSVAPVTESSGPGRGGANDPAVQLRRRRAKAKAARQ
jgi:hypothetical protein